MRTTVALSIRYSYIHRSDVVRQCRQFMFQLIRFAQIGKVEWKTNQTKIECISIWFLMHSFYLLAMLPCCRLRIPYITISIYYFSYGRTQKAWCEFSNWHEIELIAMRQLDGYIATLCHTHTRRVDEVLINYHVLHTTVCVCVCERRTICNCYSYSFPFYLVFL